MVQWLYCLWLSTDCLHLGPTNNWSAAGRHRPDFGNGSAGRWGAGAFCQAVCSSLRWLHSSGDNADDFLRRLIPTDEVLKGKITWGMQSSLKSSLTYCAKIAREVLTADKIVDTWLCAPPSSQKNKFKFFTPPNVLGKEHYRLKVDKSSECQPMLPELATSTGSKAKVSQYTVLAQNLLHTEELMRTAAIYGSITDSGGIHSEVYPAWSLRLYKNKWGSCTSPRTIATVTAAADNLQLIRRDVVLGQLQLQDEHITRTRAAPFHGHSLVGPDAEKFDEKIVTMRDQHALHRGLTSRRNLLRGSLLSPSYQFIRG